MQREEQLRVLKQVIARLDEGTNVDAGGIRHNPTWVYTCKDLAAREWDSFYRGYPQLIGVSADLPEPGSFLTTNDFGTPVLATRTADGSFRAFVNVCRHRGVLLEAEERGRRAKFVCPFHAWTYDNEGELAVLPKADHFGKIDPSCHGLVPLPAVERFGLLWVHPQPDGTIELDSLLGGLAPEFEAWPWDELVNVGYDTYEMRLNWKLANDTFGETYHFTTLHRDSLALNFHGNVQAYDTFGRNHRMTLVRREIDEMRTRPEDTWEICQGTFPVYYLFPNVQINVTPFGFVLVRTYPKPGDPAHSVSRIGFYSRAEPLERNGDMIRGISQNFASIIRDEDYAVAARSQLGAEAGVPEYNVFGRNEPALHHYHNTYREALGMEPLELLPD
jgi:phenylpropionate dioxygenase-like ring-hydroxylating dioxygenase large terminal subunit